MDSPLPLILFLLFLFGSTLLILAVGIMSHGLENPEDEDVAAPELHDTSVVSGFFGGSGPFSFEPDVLALRDVEDYLHEERRLAETFVSEPSPEKLYDAPHPGILSQATFLHNVEAHLRDEQTWVSAFVADPSLENLYGHFGMRSVHV